jgi:serine/threonine protein phosphatase PrpC
MTTSHTERVHVNVAAKSDVGRVRTNNEDAFLIADLTRGGRVADEATGRLDVGDKGVLLVVSDGMGGEQAGEVASALVVEAFTRTLRAAPTHLPPAAQLKYAAAKAHLDVAAASRRRGREGMGATLTVVHVLGPTSPRLAIRARTSYAPAASASSRVIKTSPSSSPTQEP